MTALINPGKPVMDWDGDQFTFSWHPIGVGIGLQNIRETHDGVWGELWVYTVNEAAERNGHLLSTRINLMDSTRKWQVARTLTDLNRSLQLDWSAMVEYVAVLTAVEFRTGTPTIRLVDGKANSADSHSLMKGFTLLRGQPTTLAADGGLGKSALAMGICTSLGAEIPLVSDTLFVPAERMACLYLDWETTEQIQLERLIEISNGLGIEPPANVYYRAMERSLPDEISKLKLEVRDKDIGLIVVDSIGPAFGGSLKDEEVAIRFFAALKGLRDKAGQPVAKLLISHVTKTGAEKEGRARAFGSGFIEFLSRQVWELKGAENVGDESTIDVGLFDTKQNTGRQLKPIGLQVRFEEGAIRFTRRDVMGSVLAQHASLQVRCWEALTQPKTTAQLAEELGSADKTVDTTLRRMSNVIQIGKGERGRGKAAMWARKSQLEAVS